MYKVEYCKSDSDMDQYKPSDLKSEEFQTLTVCIDFLIVTQPSFYRIYDPDNNIIASDELV